jgi:hypothetical protein
LQQEDYLKRQIDQLGRVLGKLLADILGFRSKGQVNAGIETTNQVLKNELGLNIDDLISISDGDFIKILQDEKKLNNENLDNLAEILFLFAEEPDSPDADNSKVNMLYEKALILYEHINETSSVYSFDRHLKIEKIKNAL